MSKVKDKFEENLISLETIVASLESGELTLSEALKQFEEGIKIFQLCQKTLEDAEMKVSVLMNDLESGQMLAVPFENQGE